MKFNEYIDKRLEKDSVLAKEFWTGYEDFKIGILLKEARIKAGYTQEQVAKKIHTTTSVISRIENHAADIRLSTIEKFAKAIGKNITVGIK